MSKQRRDHTHSAQLTTRSSCLLSTQASARTGARPSTPPIGPRFADDPGATRRDLAAQARALGVDPDYVGPAIGAAMEAWEAVPDGAFAGTTRREHLAALVRGGWFARLVQACAGGRGPDTVVASMLLDPSLARLKNFRAVAMTWAAPLRAARAHDPEPCADAGFDGGAPEEASPPLHLLLARAQRRQAAIVRRINDRKTGGVGERVEQLLAVQLQAPDGAKYAVRTLCDLAARADARGLRPLQLWLTERALAVNPDDEWVHHEHWLLLRRAMNGEEASRVARRTRQRCAEVGASAASQ